MSDITVELTAELESLEDEGVRILLTVPDTVARADALKVLFARRRRVKRAIESAAARYVARPIAADTSDEAEEAVSEILEELGLSAFRVAVALLLYVRFVEGSGAYGISVPGVPDACLYSPELWDWSQGATRDW